jgi:hypothetical protein
VLGGASVEACKGVVRTDTATRVSSGGPATAVEGRLPVSVVAAVIEVILGVASCMAPTAGNGFGVLVFVGLAGTPSDPLEVVGLLDDPSSASGSGDAVVSVGVGCLVTGAEESSLGVAPASAVVVSGSVELLEADDSAAPVESGESSAQASPPPHPLTMAAPIPTATAKPPIRTMYASAGMRYV